MKIVSGDVVELELEDGAMSALVLLATPEGIILDPCDGTMPFVVDALDLRHIRVFDGHAVAELAA